MKRREESEKELEKSLTGEMEKNGGRDGIR